MITSKLVRPILSTSAAFASFIRPANTPQFQGIGLGSGIFQQPLRKMHIQSIPMCMCCSARGIYLVVGNQAGGGGELA